MPPDKAGRRVARVVAGPDAARRLGLGALVLVLAGCGFQLRSWEVADSLRTLHIEADSSVDLSADLEAALRGAGVAVVGSGQGADVVLDLAEQRLETRSATITSAALATDVELALEVAFAAFAPASSEDGAEAREVVPRQVLRVVRIARVDRDNLVGSSREQALLLEEMRAELIDRILRALATVSRAGAPPAGV